MGERTILEARKLLNSTLNSEKDLGAPAASHQPKLTSAASKCDELVSRLTASLLQLRDPQWQARQQAVKRIILAWRGRAWRKWFRVATMLLWGRMRDPASGDYFFVNMFTLKTSWDPPVVFGRQVKGESVRRIYPTSLNIVAGAVAVQRMWRGFSSRAKLAETFGHFWRRVLVNQDKPGRDVPRPRDPSQPWPPPFYYYNILPAWHRRWQSSSLEKPRILNDPRFQPHFYGEHPEDESRISLAVQVQGLSKKFSFRIAFFKLAAQRYCRIWDADYNRYFYYNKTTGQSTWVKPMKSLLKAWEPPVLKGGEAPPGALDVTTGTIADLKVKKKRVEGGSGDSSKREAKSSAGSASAISKESVPGVFSSWFWGSKKKADKNDPKNILRVKL